MADLFIDALPTTTTIKRADLFVVETDPAGTQITKAMAALDFAKGWIEIPDTWTYASARTINVPTDATLLYQKGWGIRFKQGGAYKYEYIINTAATLLTVEGGSDYTVANAAITDIAVCPNPHTAFGFPDWFNYTVTPTAGSGSFTTVAGTGKFKVDGRAIFCKAKVTITTNGTAAGYVGANVPVATADLYQVLHGKEAGVSSKTLNASFYPDSTHLAISFYDGTYPGANNAICAVNGSYEY
jgi:hypothetical protein